MDAPPATDAIWRLAVLRSLVEKLAELFTDLVSAGDRHPATQQLGEVLLKLRSLLGNTVPDEAQVHDLYAKTETALRSWLAIGTTAAPREGFWK
jgi:hypothetical protein